MGYIGSCSPDDLLTVDHGVNHHILQRGFARRGQSVPEEDLVDLSGKDVTFCLRETERRVPAACRMGTGMSVVCRICAFSIKNFSV